MPRRKGDVQHRPTDENRALVRAMTIAGIGQEQQALVLGISQDTLAKYYRREIDSAEPQAIARVAAKLYEQCMQGNTSAMIFYLKTRGRWAEQSRVEVTGAEAGPLVAVIKNA